MKWSSCTAVALVAIAAFVTLGPLAACDPSTPGVANRADAGPDTGPDAGICCPMRGNACDCIYIGGTRGSAGECIQVCDAPPPSLRETIDENGCPVLTSVPYSGRGCGPDPNRDAGGDPDAGVDSGPDGGDAGPGDAAPSDVSALDGNVP